MNETEPGRQRLALLWVYDDREDAPYVVVDPPDNLPALLGEWRGLDRTNSNADEGVPEWDFVDKWLAARGVDVRVPDGEFWLGHY